MPTVSYVCVVDGVPITWFEIEQWHTDMLIKDRKKAMEIGDPYVSEKVCEKIAHIIYSEMVQKITGRMGINIAYENEKLKRDRDHDKRYNKYFNSFSPRMSNEEFKYHNYEKWSSMGKFQEIMEFAKRKAQEQLQKTQYIPPKPPEPPKLIKWKEILELPTDNRIIDERIIKVCFRKLARKYHPDLQGGDETKMKELIEARNAAYKAIGKY
jgi:hypothetical protein